MAAVALTTKQLKEDIFASIEYSVHFHAQIEERNDRDEMILQTNKAMVVYEKVKRGKTRCGAIP